MASKPANDGFETVSEESPTVVKFDTFGDQFTGVFIGTNIVEFVDNKGEEKKYTQYLFRGVGGAGIVAGDLYALNDSYKIRQGMSKVHEGETARLTYIKDVPTGQPAPMKDVTVEVKR